MGSDADDFLEKVKEILGDYKKERQKRYTFRLCGFPIFNSCFFRSQRNHELANLEKVLQELSDSPILKITDFFNSSHTLAGLPKLKKSYEHFGEYENSLQLEYKKAVILLLILEFHFQKTTNSSPHFKKALKKMAAAILKSFTEKEEFLWQYLIEVKTFLSSFPEHSLELKKAQLHCNESSLKYTAHYFALHRLNGPNHELLKECSMLCHDLWSIIEKDFLLKKPSENFKSLQAAYDQFCNKNELDSTIDQVKNHLDAKSSIYYRIALKPILDENHDENKLRKFNILKEIFSYYSYQIKKSEHIPRLSENSQYLYYYITQDILSRINWVIEKCEKIFNYNVSILGKEFL